MHDIDNAPNCEPAPYPVADLSIPPGVPLREIERRAYEQALERNHGNRTHAARELGVTVRTVQRKLKRWNSEQPKIGNVDAAIRKLRAAGLDAWDDVDVEATLKELRTP